MGFFKEGTVVETSPVASEDDDSGEMVTLPENMPEHLRLAYRDLEQAQKRLLRGHYKASVEFAADAVNRIACGENVNGQASY